MPECGECTACCELLPVTKIRKPAGVVCEHLEDGNCNINDSKPYECSGFECVYRQTDEAPISLRPDNCKMVFQRMTDRMCIGALHPEHDITEAAKIQIASLNEQGVKVIVTVNGHQHSVYRARAGRL
jgi:hypothetical protein